MLNKPLVLLNSDRNKKIINFTIMLGYLKKKIVCTKSTFWVEKVNQFYKFTDFLVVINDTSSILRVLQY